MKEIQKMMNNFVNMHNGDIRFKNDILAGSRNNISFNRRIRSNRNRFKMNLRYCTHHAVHM